MIAKHPHRCPLGSETGIADGNFGDLFVKTAEVKRLANGVATEKGTEP